MDAYEATRVVFSRIQSLDPENAAKVMGLLLIEGHGEKEMIRLAFGPEALLHSVVLKARKELGLLPPSVPVSPSSAAPPSPFPVPRQGSRLLPSSWPPPLAFSRMSGNALLANCAADESHSHPDEIINTGNGSLSPFYGGGGGGDLFDEFLLQEQLAFLNDGANGNPTRGGQIGPKGEELFYPETGGECRSPSGKGEGLPFPYSTGWGPANGGGSHRRSCYAADQCLGSDGAGAGPGPGWKPCLYYARGYCKNGSSCRFLHGLPDDDAAAVEQQFQELLLRSKSQRPGGATPVSPLMASAFPYPSTGSLPPSPPGKCMNFPLQLQNESQRAAALMLGGDDAHKFMGRPRFERGDLAAMGNPGSRQIYLTFPADSTFREEDVSKYFSTFGPVQDVRIPYQQKRMFGFVTFVHPDTVKLILSKGNPHFVCNARVLVKPYKEKGKVPDRKQQQHQQQAERGDFAGCATPTGLDSRDPYDLSQFGARMLYNKSSLSSQEAILRRRLEEEQQAAELQQAIELQGRRFMGLQLLNLNTPNHISNSSRATISAPPITPSSNGTSNNKNPSQREGTPPPPLQQERRPENGADAAAVNAAAGAADKKESTPDDGGGFQESVEHGLPDSPFASPTKLSLASFSPTGDGLVAAAAAASPLSNTNTNTTNNKHLMGSSPTLPPPTPTLDNASYNSGFFHMPRFSGYGTIGM